MIDRAVLSQEFKDRLPDYAARIDDRLGHVLPAASVRPRRLHEAMRYAVFNGGKRVRPLLVFATGECLDVATPALDAPAVALELIHAFSLVHDDLPAMDDDDLRRGKPTLHIQYDEATAILAADALQPLAFGVLSGAKGIADEQRNALVTLIADACGSLGMTGGQALDLAAEGQTISAAELEHLYSLKTGALIHASVTSAAILADDLSDDHRVALDEFGRSVGIAFQIKDDILDVVGDTDLIGKPVGSDASLNKATYPALFGLKQSQERCDELLSNALHCLQPFGRRAAPLEWLARYIVERIS